MKGRELLSGRKVARTRRIEKLSVRMESFQRDFAYVEDGTVHQATWFLHLIREAWGAGCDFEDLADGFGTSGTGPDGDWSGIRDSSPSAKLAMTQRALNFLRFMLEKASEKDVEAFNRRERSS
jgi:hypothetical protein